MRQNEAVVRSGSPQPRRGRRRGKRIWVPNEASASAFTAQPGDARPTDTRPMPAGDPATEPPVDRYQPRRRYPWHDDPHYDPAAHRRPAAPPSSWSPPAPGRGYDPPAADRPAEPTRPVSAAAPTPEPDPDPGAPDGIRMPRKLTVTRVAALRSRQLTRNGIRAFHRAASADGADRSGLTALTYATMFTYAVDAAVAVALANTLFFAAATAESKTNVALYLAITVAPFAVVAPVIGPLLDRLQRGRRAALAVSFGGRAVLAVVMAFSYDSWLLYPAALGMLVLSKSFVVLKAAVTPRVLPPSITLVTTNARLTTFGLVAGGVFGAGAAGVAALWGSPGALVFTSALAVTGTVLCLRIPRWVESTAGEVPAALRSTARGRRRPITRGVLIQLWANGSIRILTGFLTLFVAFVVKAQTETDPKRQLLLLGMVGAAAGTGAFLGNAVGARRRFGHPDTVALICIGAAVAVAVVAAVLPGIATAAAVGLVGAVASALAKVCLDAVIQRDLPDESRASAFGRSETVLQLSWVFGGALGVLLPHDNYWVGFTVVAAVVALFGLQTGLLTRGRTMLPVRSRRRAGAGADPGLTRTAGAGSVGWSGDAADSGGPARPAARGLRRRVR
jgi:MFS family permease